MCETNKPPLLLSRKQIMDFWHFHKAVVVGGLDQGFYTKLCGMAIAYLEDHPDHE